MRENVIGICSHCCLHSWLAAGGCWGTVSGLAAVRNESDRLKRIADPIERFG